MEGRGGGRDGDRGLEGRGRGRGGDRSLEGRVVDVVEVDVVVMDAGKDVVVDVVVTGV